MDKPTSVSARTAIDSLRIDVAAVVRSRLPGYAPFIPRFAVRGLERLICQEDLNRLLGNNIDKRGMAFCRGVLSDLGVTYNIIGEEHLPDAADRRVVYVSNHPLGALDGIALIEMVGRRHGCEPLFVVNDLLMAVKPLCGVFVPVNKHGAQSHSATLSLNQAFESERPVIVFPSGLASRRGDDGRIHDLPWRKMVVKKAVDYRRDIIPLYFDGENSPFFYNFAKLRSRSPLKFNLEMLLLPREFVKAKGRRFSIVAGPRVPYASLDAAAASAEAARLCNLVYSLKSQISCE